MNGKRTPRILAIILAGGQGGRLGVLTERRAKPVMPFLGTYRLIDFPLSHCAHSSLTDVWVVEQYHPFALNTHLANGRPWDLDRLRGGLRVLPPYERREGKDSGDAGFAEGNADALWRNREFIADFAPDLLLVLSADHLYRLDYRELIDAHRGHDGAAVTLVHVPVPPGEDARRFGNVVVGGDSRVTEFAYKPDSPKSDRVTAEVFLYDARRLLETLEELAGRDGAKLKDFGHELLPRLVDAGEAFGFAHDGYWRDVGTVESYHATHLDFLGDAPPLRLDEPGWPILTFDTPRPPARVAAAAGAVSESLISPGCRVSGTVTRSVLGPGVIVEPGATVTDSVLLADVHLMAEALVNRAVIDQRATVGQGARVGGSGGNAPLTVIGEGVRMSPGAVVPAGQQIAPGEEL